MTWQFSTWFVAPQCCGATPTDLVPYDGPTVMPILLVELLFERVGCGD